MKLLMREQFVPEDFEQNLYKNQFYRPDHQDLNATMGEFEKVLPLEETVEIHN